MTPRPPRHRWTLRGESIYDDPSAQAEKSLARSAAADGVLDPIGVMRAGDQVTAAVFALDVRAFAAAGLDVDDVRRFHREVAAWLRDVARLLDGETG